MPETIVQQPRPTQAVTPAATVSTPKVETPTPAAVTPTPEQKPDLLKRAASVATPAPEARSAEAPKVTLALEDVKDPIARQILEKKLGEANQAISKTFGEVGAEKSRYIQEVERMKSELDKTRQEINQPWTPERLQRELNRQDFVSAATTLQQTVAPTGYTQESWSSLSPEEKQTLQQSLQKTQALEQQLNQMQQSQVISQADTKLKELYPDYEPTQINKFYEKAAANQMSAQEIREAIYLAQNARTLIDRAYELGRQDNKSTFQEKLNGASPSGFNMTPTTTIGIERKAGERSSNAFSRHAHGVLDMLRSMPRK